MADAKAAKKPAKAKKAAPASAKTTTFATKKFESFTIKAKRSGRFLVLGANGKPVNGAEKLKVLIGAKLLKESAPKATEAATEEAPST